MASRRYRGHPLADEPQRTFDVLRESGKVWSEGFGKPPGGLSELAPLSTCFTAAATPSVLSRSVHRRTPAPARSRASMFKCWSMLLGSPITGTPAANACCVVGLPPLQSTTAERAAAASPGR